MVDLSLPELAVIAVVALLVLGPERLPGAARTVGALLRRAQRSWSGLRADIERELAADELKRQLKQTRDDLGIDDIRRDLDGARGAIARDLDPRPAKPPTPSIAGTIDPPAVVPAEPPAGAMPTSTPGDADASR